MKEVFKIKVMAAFLLWLSVSTTYAQQELLMNTDDVRIDAMTAVNDMYNFEFEKAEKQFRWLKQQYPQHPLPYFLLGLSQWWRMLSDFDNVFLDKKVIAFMDTCIFFSEKMFEKNENNIEATFFCAAAYGFKGRLYADRQKWRKAVSNGLRSLKYIKEGEDLGEFSFEFLFGAGLYNYYSVWIPENYFWVKPFLAFKSDGDKEQGLDQLKKVGRMAFYTRTEAQYFLMRIYSNEENKPLMAMPFSKYLHETFPNNSYFHRFYARLCFWTGDLTKTEQLCLSTMARIDSGFYGYCRTDGRYSSYMLGYIYDFYKRDREKAINYYEMNRKYSEKEKIYDSRYYHGSLTRLASFALEDGNVKKAKKLYKKVMKYADKETNNYKVARKFLKDK